MLGGMTKKVAVLVNRAALDGEVVPPQRDQRGLKPWGPIRGMSRPVLKLCKRVALLPLGRRLGVFKPRKEATP